MTSGQKLYAAHVAKAKNPRTWKPWVKLTSAIQSAWEKKAEVKEAHTPKPAEPKPVEKKKTAKKKAAKKAGKGKGK